MITLANTTDKVQLTTTIATATLEVLVEYMQAAIAAGILTDGTFAPLAMQRTTFSGAATTDILTAPASNFVRKATFITVRNTHATIAQTVLIEVLVAASATDFGGTVTLQAGEWLYITETGVWFVHDANGGVKTSSATGRLLKTTLLTSGTSFTTQMATTSLKVSMVGGGGGGGGCTSIASAAIGAGGGGAGGYADKTFVVTPNTAYAYTIGAAGNGVSGAGGANGGNTTFVVGGTTVTAFGGSGAAVAAPATTLKTAAGGVGAIVSTNGDVNSGGEPGQYGVVLIIATAIVASGKGGPSVYGSGGAGIIAVGNGLAATGYGAGGGGSATGASAVRTGGNGTGGCIVVAEYA